jgi:hypothetical protein
VAVNVFLVSAEVIEVDRRAAREISLSAAVASRAFYLRARDSGTGYDVIWGPMSRPDELLAPTTTSPQYTGTLSGIHVAVVI